MAQFLSDEWIEAVRKLYEEPGEAPPAAMADLKLNILVTDGPHGDREAHMAAGRFGAGLLEDAPTKVTMPFDDPPRTTLHSSIRTTRSTPRPRPWPSGPVRTETPSSGAWES